MPSTNTTASKKPKTSNDQEDFEVLRRHIQNHPLAKNSDNAAVKAALSGLEQELKRQERDAKLQRKFSKGKAGSNTATSSATSDSSNQQQQQQTTTTADSNADEDEWQDIAMDRKKASTNPKNDAEDGVEIIDVEGETSYLGQLLAQEVVRNIAESHSKSRSPVAAIALALHAAMRSELLGFACTGVPDDSNKKSNGFAAPVRELPRGQFLPKDWDKNASDSNGNSHQQQLVSLRYRKDGTGSVHLKVAKPADQLEVTVKLVPGATQEPPSETLTFPLDQHINLDSWNAALRVANSSLGVEPALHYKGLPALMSSFAKTFDLGCIRDTRQQQEEVPPSFFPPPNMAPPNGCTDGSTPRLGPPIVVGHPSRGNYDDRGPTFDNSFPQPHPLVGDFAGDLAPGGMTMDPLRRAGPDMTGNMMGPNHPAFRGGGMMVGPPGGGRFGMQPRFDPFGPPGGPQEIDPDSNNEQPNGRSVPPHLRPARSGDPNPDHLKPPNSLGNNSFGGNMFM